MSASAVCEACDTVGRARIDREPGDDGRARGSLSTTTDLREWNGVELVLSDSPSALVRSANGVWGSWLVPSREPFAYAHSSLGPSGAMA